MRGHSPRLVGVSFLSAPENINMSKRMKSLAGLALLSYLLTLALTAPASVFAAVSPDGWGTQDSGTISTLHDVWGTSPTDVYACGSDGAVICYDGISWAPMSSNTTSDLYSLWGDSADDIFAVGESGIILHYDGTSWSTMAKPLTGHLKGVWGSAPDNVFAVGNSGTILSYNGTGWDVMASGTASHLSDVWGSAANNVFAAGNNGLILNYDGMVWTEVAAGHPNIAGIWGSASDAFAVGNGGTILHYDGALPWSEMVDTGTSEDLYGIWGTGPSDVFTVGNAGTILHYNGTDWTAMASGTTDDLHGIWGVGPFDVFAVGQTGTILHYQESAPIITSVNPDHANQSEVLTVTISGAKFDGATGVHFGAGVTVDNFSVESSLITASISVAHDAVTGTRDILITTADATGVLTGGFSIPHATITGLNPTSGDQGDMPEVVISGTNLGGATAVTFGNGVTTTSFVVDSPTQITASAAIAPSAVTGTRDVSVITPGSTATLYGAFSIPASGITTVSPVLGTQGQTLEVVIDGANLYGATAVSFGDGIAVNHFNVDSPNQISVEINISRDAADGLRDVTVTTSGGEAVLNDAFTVVAVSQVTDVGPNSGRQGDTMDVVITGYHLEDATTASFGAGADAIGIAINIIRIDGPTQITVNISINVNASPGLRDVVVVTPLGTATLADAFTVEQAAPCILSVEPGSGRQGEILNVLIHGTNLLGIQSVNFGNGITVNRFTPVDFTTMRVSISIATDAEPGSRDASIANQSATFTLADGFTVEERADGQLSLWAFITAAIAAGLVTLTFIVILALKRRRRKPEEQNLSP